MTFDHQDVYKVGKITLLFDRPQKPEYVDIAVSSDNSEPWQEFGRITPDAEESRWYKVGVGDAVSARYVKMFFKLKEWGWYLREVKMWGRRVEPGADEVTPRRSREIACF